MKIIMLSAIIVSVFAGYLVCMLVMFSAGYQLPEKLQIDYVCQTSGTIENKPLSELLLMIKAGDVCLVRKAFGK